MNINNTNTQPKSKQNYLMNINFKHYSQHSNNNQNNQSNQNLLKTSKNQYLTLNKQRSYTSLKKTVTNQTYHLPNISVVTNNNTYYASLIKNSRSKKGFSFSVNQNYIPNLIRLYNCKKAKIYTKKITNPDAKQEDLSLAKRIQNIQRSKSLFSKHNLKTYNQSSLFKSNFYIKNLQNDQVKYLNMLKAEVQRKKVQQKKKIQLQNQLLQRKIKFQIQNNCGIKNLKKRQKQLQNYRKLIKKVKIIR